MSSVYFTTMFQNNHRLLEFIPSCCLQKTSQSSEFEITRGRPTNNGNTNNFSDNSFQRIKILNSLPRYISTFHSFHSILKGNQERMSVLLSRFVFAKHNRIKNLFLPVTLSPMCISWHEMKALGEQWAISGSVSKRMITSNRNVCLQLSRIEVGVDREIKNFAQFVPVVSTNFRIWISFFAPLLQ